MPTTLTFNLRISREQALRYYQGTAQAISVIADNGQRVQFPASHIRSYVTETGIQGRFRLRFDDHFKLIALEKIAD